MLHKRCFCFVFSSSSLQQRFINKLVTECGFHLSRRLVHLEITKQHGFQLFLLPGIYAHNCTLSRQSFAR